VGSPGRGSAFFDALGSQDVRSVALVDLMVRKGCDLERLYRDGGYVGICPFRYLLEGPSSLEDKVAKFIILMNVGIEVDWSLLRQRKSSYSEILALCQSIAVRGREARNIFPGVMQEFLPEVLTHITGEYAYPYYVDNYNYDNPELDKDNPDKLARYLIESREECDLHKMEQLLDLHADPYFSLRGMHRLYQALRDPRDESVGVVQLLVRKGFDVHRTCRGETALEALEYRRLSNENKKAKLEALGIV
jgi:hypothetical protein